MQRGRGQPGRTTALRQCAIALCLVLAGATALADPPGPRRDGQGRVMRDGSGVQPYHVPRRHDADPRALPAPRLQAPGPRRGVNDVINMVERRYGGKVVGVDDAGNHYRVRLLQRDGRVRTLEVPLNGY